MQLAVYTIKQASQMLQLSERTVFRHVEEGKIPKVPWSKGRVLIPAYFFKELTGESLNEEDMEELEEATDEQEGDT
jgi:predicted site-specific integrase-resolvase